MAGLLAPAVVPVSGANFVRPTRDGDGIRLYGSSSGFVGFKAASAAGSTDYTLPSADGTNGQVLSTNGSGTLSWITVSASPGGSTTHVQFNDGGVFAGDASFVWDKTNDRLGIGDTTGAASPDKHLHVCTTTNLEGILLEFAHDSHTTAQCQLLFRRSRGTFSSQTETFDASLGNRIAWEQYDGSAYRPCAEIMVDALTNPAVGQANFPGRFTIKCGSYNSASYLTALTISGGNAAFTAVPRVAVGNGTQDGNQAFEVTMSSTNDAATHWQNTAGDVCFGINSAGDLVLTRSGFLNTTVRMISSDTQIHFVQDTNVYGTGEVVVEGDGTGVLFSVCRQGTPGANVVMNICDWSTAVHTKFFENGGFIFNETGNDADCRIEGDTDANLFFTDASTDRIGIGASDPAVKLDIASDSIRIRTAKTPATAGAAGVTGQLAWDSGFWYVCVNTNTWQRVAHATW